MFENIEKIIRSCGVLCIEEERYGSRLLAGFDFSCASINNATNTKVATCFYRGIEVKDAIYVATSAGDVDAIEALSKLEEYASRCPEFLYVSAENFDEVMQKLEKRAKLWNNISKIKQDNILLNFVSFFKI